MLAILPPDLELMESPSGVGMGDVAPDPTVCLSILSLWKSFRFTGLVVIDILLCRMANLFAMFTTNVVFPWSSNSLCNTPSHCVHGTTMSCTA